MTLPEPTIHYSETALEILRARYLKRGFAALRNATVTCVAPTGTISLIAGVSSSIEPYFALALSRRVLDGVIRTEVNPLVEAELTKLGALGLSAREFIEKHGSLRSLTQLPAELRRRFPSALEIAPQYHVGMQAAFQKHVDAAGSKPHEQRSRRLSDSDIPPAKAQRR